ncbi:cytochrome P450, partial [Suillus subalutaceus]|uniref:cytochrome P450 n=1 Tax=Suillus subalutaceus TaxID=48586 RepID=UPI001B882D75
VIVVSDATVLKEFMDMRSNETSGRPSFYTGSLITDGYFIAEADSTTDIWRMGRKALQTLFAPQSVNKQLPVAVAESSQLLFDLLCSPQGFEKHIDRYTFSILLSIAFGKRCPRPDTEEKRLFYEGVRLTVQVVSTEGPPVDLLPILKYVPERWAPWKGICREARTLQRRLYFGLLEEAETRLARGESTSCLWKKSFSVKKSSGCQRTLLRDIPGPFFGILHFFTHSMFCCLPPLRKAQNVINSVLPDGRPPTMDDIASLPYVRAILREVHRLKPMAPLGMPHALLETQEYRSHVAPKGTTVFINACMPAQILSEVFDEPEVFRPERFLLSEHGTKPGVDSKDWRASIPFGSGRRLCPEMNLVNTNLAFTIATLVWAFDFAPAIDPATKAPIPVDIDSYEEGLVFRPRSFTCSILPRNEAKARLIRQKFADATPAFSKYELFLTKEEK